MVTISFLERSFALTDRIFDEVIGEQVAANRLMERGNLAEFRGKTDPASFRQAYQHMVRSLKAMDTALKDYDALVEFLDKDPGLPIFTKTLERLLAEAGPMERITRRPGARYSDLGVSVPGHAKSSPEIFKDLASVLRAQQEDLKALRQLTEETNRRFQDVLPLTEKGEFVRSMLSGRWAFGDRYEEMVEARSTFSHFYTRSCMVSIQAVMQVYPAGFSFLERR
ncbi:MAG: hypothetical protein HYY11_09560 [Candidatus Methylomirabilis oxyfera]|nr:hypothetical protein [Candidatus Methylomirabilis oxyfera]